MAVFDNVTLEWDGRKYVIPANRVMGAIARVEQHITLTELSEDSRRERLKLSTVAAAYASVLRYAGADVTDEAVYGGMFAGGYAADVIGAATFGLLTLMVPPSGIAAAKASLEKNVAVGNLNRRARRAAASSSRKRSS